MCHQPPHLLVTSHSSASRYCVVRQWRALCLVCAAAFALNSLLSICNQNDFFNKSFLFAKIPTVKHCAIALSLLITLPFALTLQQIFLRQTATNTHLPSPSQKPYHIFIITPHLAHPPCKKRLAIGSQKSILLAPLHQSHVFAKLDTPSPSFNPAPLSKTHQSPSAEYVAVAIQTKYIYYSTAALAYYPHMR